LLLKQTTELVVRTLKRGYIDQNTGKQPKDWKPFRLGFSELALLSGLPAGADLTMLSRCLDFGLAIGSLVPSTAPNATGPFVYLRRVYRTSEQTHIDDDDRVVDLQFALTEIATETVAVIVRFLCERSKSSRWAKGSVPPLTVNKILAILQRAMPEMRQTGIAVLPGPHGAESYLRIPRDPEMSEEFRLLNLTSGNFFVTAEGELSTTRTFDARYDAGDLLISRRRQLLTLESYLAAIVPVLDNATNITDLLVAWSMTADGRLGLNYVMWDIELGLRELDKPLEVLRGGRVLEPPRLARSITLATGLVGVARNEKLRVLKEDWSTDIRERWQKPVTVERELMSTLQAPTPHDRPIFDIAAGFCDVVRAFTEVVASLAALASPGPQASLFGDQSEDPKIVATEALRALRRLQTILQTMREPTDSVQSLECSDLEVELASNFRHFVRILRRYAAAFSWRLDRQLPSEPRTPGVRSSVVLFVDFAGSTPRSLEDEPRTYAAWMADGLHLISQWATAFGARELRDPGRKGDDITLEFADPDSAVLCAALVQEHFASLRATGNKRVSYDARCGIDQGSIEDADEDNRLSAAINRAAKLAKSQEPNQIALTPEVERECSNTLRSFLDHWGAEIDLRARPSAQSRFTPRLADREGIVRAYAQRLAAARI
jgi:class 3 adenylate cyclase